MRLILHVGTHKTGTTSIQAAMLENRDWLAERGFLYPDLFGSRSHHVLGHRLALARNDEIDEIRSAVVASVDPALTTVISAEGLSARIVGTVDWEGFDNQDYWSRRTEFLDRLKAALRDFEDIEVFLCLRRADEFAQSLYSTMLQSGRISQTFEEFVTAVGPIFDYQQQIRAMERVFGEINVCSYEALSVGLVPNFFRWAGIPLPPKANQVVRPSPDGRLVSWLYSTMKGKFDDAEGRQLRREFMNSSRAKALYASGHATFWNDEPARIRLLERSCEGLGSSFFGDWAPKGTVSAYIGEAEMERIERAFHKWRAARQLVRLARSVPLFFRQLWRDSGRLHA